MITALSVVYPDKGKGLKRLFYYFKQDKISVQMKTARGVNLKHIIYTSFSGDIKLEKIDKIIGAQRNRLLCAESLKLPADMGYKRFYSPEFTARLCSNLALYVLQSCVNADRLKVGIYDPQARCCDLLIHVMRFCSDVAVVTDCEKPYFAEQSRVLDELGASAVITQRRDELVNRDMIIAPYNICERLSLRQDAVVLTNGCPKERTGGLVYYKYHLRMPNGFDRIKPKELDEEYFCSALYTQGGQYELGSIVPTVCRNYSYSQTAKSLIVSLDNRA